MFRAPIYLYRTGLGWLLGDRFLLLHHVGRRSGLPRQTVLEVADHDAATDTYYIVSGFGHSSQWFKNLKAHPEVDIQVGSRRLAVRAEVLDADASGERMVDYARRHPMAAQALSRVLGLEVDGTEAAYRKAGREQLPFVALRPRRVLRETPTAQEIAIPLLLALAFVLALWLGSRGRRKGGFDQFKQT
jgi:deazaflavin-dependent oxidoreductase (nitroreductase family)